MYRETGSIEKHADALVALLESCLCHSLAPSSKGEDPPHTKIASDVLSCIFLVSSPYIQFQLSTKIFCVTVIQKLISYLLHLRITAREG
jgi:hypothetical protein